ncbi:hypothetical protein TorRG33x02_267410 [Trema orientale]|uniref:Uncharacterized protein n=1 Tax=Trema orientale TaxID=63057 RepID=A0A2P5CZW5_TREOI|nr:hypothetical protein TorRG33x02_267410 [Trema orientale]
MAMVQLNGPDEFTRLEIRAREANSASLLLPLVSVSKPMFWKLPEA